MRLQVISMVETFYAFLQHIIKSMDDETGRCAILFPHGVLFRNEESSMRAELVKGDYVECVIGLAANLFYNSPMEACIMICKMNKKPQNRGKILFINAVNEVERKNAQSFLTDNHIKHQNVIDAYHMMKKYEDEEGFATVATIDEIEKNDYSLSIPLYVKTSSTEAETDNRPFVEIYRSWEKKSDDMHASYEELNRLLQEVGNVES